ncbi:MAG: glycoside hydrolase family 2 protein [Christensenellales bacterium]|jgi:beta-galactosidase/beta-glucuronidase
MTTLPRSEYPRPQMVRPDWINLNGTWQFEIDHGDSGRARGLVEKPQLDGQITVPFCPESPLSGVGYKDFMAAVWYRRTFTLPDNWQGKRVLLHIGACDYRTEVWVNGRSVGVHVGGYVSFCFEITQALAPGENTLVICAQDDTRSGAIPSGKQSNRYGSYDCVYTRTTGIWQTVWLEAAPQAYVARTRMIPDIDTGELNLEVFCEGAHGMTVSAQASYQGAPMARAEARITGNVARMTLKLAELHLWQPGDPALYDLALNLGEDRVTSYFGMRSIACVDGKLLLNGKPLFQRLVLDQGFYPDGIYTAPTDAELQADIQRSLDMGFNGARLHEKIFEPRFLSHADRMGYLVWGEHANWGLDVTDPGALACFLPEWLEAVQRDFDHPALVGWCPFNETQRNQDDRVIETVYRVTKALDPTRPVIDSSGWVHVVSDLYCVHDYTQDPEQFRQIFKPLAPGEKAEGELAYKRESPFVSEYGGIWWQPGGEGWGYGERPKDEAEFLARYKGLTEALLFHPGMCAFCYTQLTDVEQEVNGLYTYDRRPKFDPAIIRAINSQRAAIETE